MDWGSCQKYFESGFSVKSIEKAVCVMKLVFFGLRDGLAEIIDIEAPPWLDRSPIDVFPKQGTNRAIGEANTTGIRILRGILTMV